MTSRHDEWRALQIEALSEVARSRRSSDPRVAELSCTVANAAALFQLYPDNDECKRTLVNVVKALRAALHDSGRDPEL